MSKKPVQSSPTSYKQNLKILQNITAKLEDVEGIDVDELIPLLDEAKRAYEVCRQRLDEVEKALQKRLPDESQQD